MGSQEEGGHGGQEESGVGREESGGRGTEGCQGGAATAEERPGSSVKDSMEVDKEEGNVRRECCIHLLPCFEIVIATAF